MKRQEKLALLLQFSHKKEHKCYLDTRGLRHELRSNHRWGGIVGCNNGYFVQADLLLDASIKAKHGRIKKREYNVYNIFKEEKYVGEKIAKLVP